MDFRCANCGASNFIGPEYDPFNPQGLTCRKCGKFVKAPGWKRRSENDILCLMQDQNSRRDGRVAGSSTDRTPQTEGERIAGRISESGKDENSPPVQMDK